ncbi:unnamed protein product [Symbiodinium sp. CCMP2592]|nr:unnamed protein product [Symbiodinium sp. CCMP2592]
MPSCSAGGIRCQGGADRILSALCQRVQGESVMPSCSSEIYLKPEIAEGQLVDTVRSEVETFRRSRSAWSNARCLLQSSAEVPQCSWRVASRSSTRWEVAATLDIHSDALCGVAWSPNQQRLLTASADGTVGLWEEQNISYSPVQNHDPEAFQLVAILGSNSHSPVRDATWSPDSELILAASLDGSARVWQLAGDASRILRNVTEEELDSDNASENDNVTRLRPPAVQGRLLEPWSVHSMLMQSDTALAVEWSSNASAIGRVLAGSRERTACVSSRDAGFEPCASSHELAERSTGASYLLGLDHSASIWHASKEIPSRWALEATLEGVRHLMVSVRWSPDGKQLLTGGSDGLARIWTLTDTDFQGSGRQRWNLRAKMQVHSQAVRAVAWSPDGQHVLTSGRKGYAYIWQPFEGDADWVLKGFLTQANGMEVPPNLTNTALHSPVNPARLDTLHSDSNMGWVSDWSPVHVATWSSDGRRIATGSPDGSVRLWLNDLTVYGRWTLEATLHGHSHEIWSMAWSPDSRQLVTGDQVGRARLWQMRDEVTSPEHEESSGEDDSPSLALAVVRAARPLLRSVQWLANRVLGEKKTNLGDTSQFSYDHMSGQWVLQRQPGAEEESASSEDQTWSLPEVKHGTRPACAILY